MAVTKHISSAPAQETQCLKRLKTHLY